MLLDKSIDIKWNNATKKWYEGKGYKYTKKGECMKKTGSSSNKKEFEYWKEKYAESKNAFESQRKLMDNRELL